MGASYGILRKVSAVARRGPSVARNIIYSKLGIWPVSSLGDHWLCSIPAFCMSLPWQHDRRSLVQRQADTLGLRALEFVDAVSAKELQEHPDRLASQYDEDGSRQFHPFGLTVKEVACSLSHAKVYRAIVDKGAPLSLVLEDDVLFRAGVLKQLKREDIPAWADLVFLSTFLADDSPLDHISGMVYGDTSYGGSGAAYLVTLAAAQTLLDAALPVKHAADGLLGRILPVSPKGQPFRQVGCSHMLRGAIVYPDPILNGSVEYYYRSSVQERR